MVRRLLLVAFLVVLAAPVQAAVTRVNSYSGVNETGAGTTVTINSVVIASGEYALVRCGWRLSAAQTISGVTFNASSTGVTVVTSTLLDTNDGEGRQQTYAINGVTGTANVVVTYSAATANIGCAVRVYSGVNLASPTGTIATAADGLATVTVNASSATGDAVDDCVVYRGAAALTIGASQTDEIELGVGASVSVHSSTEAGAGTVTMSWTGADGSSEWATVAIPLVADAGGGGGGAARNCTLLGVCE